MTSINQSAVTTLRQLVDWYDRDEADDDELERITTRARDLVQQSQSYDESDPTNGREYVLYDLDRDGLLSTEVYPSYADAAAEAAGLDDVLILRLPLPFKHTQAAGCAEDEIRCDCELPGFFCCGVPGILAHLEGGRVAPGARSSAAISANSYESDEAAQQKLIELGIL